MLDNWFICWIKSNLLCAWSAALLWNCMMQLRLCLGFMMAITAESRLQYIRAIISASLPYDSNYGRVQDISNKTQPGTHLSCCASGTANKTQILPSFSRVSVQLWLACQARSKAEPSPASLPCTWSAHDLWAAQKIVDVTGLSESNYLEVLAWAWK